MIRRHVLRNALMPTIAVIATQVGYLVGGLVAIEFLFNYRGSATRFCRPHIQKDSPCYRRRAHRRHRLPRGDSVADILFAVLNPRIRYEAAE